MPIGRPLSLSTNIASTTVNVVASSNQTVFIVNGGYRVNELSVYRNGVRLVDTQDYTARDGSTVTLHTAAGEGDFLEFHIFDTFNVADTLSANDGDLNIDGSISLSGAILPAGGVEIGIQSAGTNITTGVITAKNFVENLGAGNTFTYDQSTKTVEISLAKGQTQGQVTAMAVALGL